MRVLRHCGAQHHFIGKCRYHLATFTAHHLVSTVGDYYPAISPDATEPTQIGLNHLFETMVFPVDWDDLDEGGCPKVTDWSGSEYLRYNDADSATAGHALVVGQVQERERSSLPGGAA
jgi:hypothetical protein